MSFKDELEKILDDVYSEGVYEASLLKEGEPLPAGHNKVMEALTSIINLVDEEVIGEDGEILGSEGKFSSRTIQEIQHKIDGQNDLRAEQRAIIRGNDV